MPTFSVQLDSMEAVKAQLTQIANQIGTVAEAVYNGINASTQDFQGDTKLRFEDVQKRYQQAHENLTNVTMVSSTSLGEVHVNIVDGEQRGVRVWGG